MYKHPLINRDKMSPQEALEILIEGNQRFLSNHKAEKDFHTLIHQTKDKQHPFVAILSCSDSRAPVELVFDQALGDIFSVRLAGNIASDKAIGSLEFSAKYLHSKLIVVMGHSGCGAVKAACDNFMDGHIGEIVNLIKPSIRFEQSVVDPDLRCSDNADFLEKVCRLNVKYQIDTILRRSDIVNDMVESKQLGIVAAVYDISNGTVSFLEETFLGR